MNASAHLGRASELLSGRSIFERFEFIQSALHFQQFSICKAAASAWDGCFGGTRRIERGDWDWSSYGFSLGKLLLRYTGRTGTWDLSIMAIAWTVVAFVPGSGGLIGLEGVSWLQLWTADPTTVKEPERRSLV